MGRSFGAALFVWAEASTDGLDECRSKIPSRKGRGWGWVRAAHSNGGRSASQDDIPPRANGICSKAAECLGGTHP